MFLLSWVGKYLTQLEKALAYGQQDVNVILNNLKINNDILETEEVSAMSCLELAIDYLHITKDQSNRLTIKKEGDFKFMGSKDLVKYVFVNIIKNAFKYARKDA